MHTQARSYEDHDQRRCEEDVERRHRVVRVAVVEVSQRCDQQGVVRRMEVGQNDESRRILTRDLKLCLALQGDVVNGSAAIGDIQLRRGIEVEEVRATQVAPDKRKPVSGPEDERADACPRGPRVAKSNQAHRALLNSHRVFKAACLGISGGQVIQQCHL